MGYTYDLKFYFDTESFNLKITIFKVKTYRDKTVKS